LAPSMKSAVLLTEETVICRSFVQSLLISSATPAPTPKDRCNASSRIGFLPSKLLGAKETIDARIHVSNGVIHFSCRHNILMLI
jgi:hypothetical protein